MTLASQNETHSVGGSVSLGQRVHPGATSLSVLVPVYNEQYLVSASLQRLSVVAESPLLDRVQVIVVDDCSTDLTPAALSAFQQTLQQSQPQAGGKLEWQFHRHERNLGKGGAVRTALEHADCELTVIHDADLEYHPRDLPKMVALFLEEGADAVFGSRFLAGDFKRALFFRHSIGNHILTFLANVASDLNLTDMETCYKMVRTELLRSIPLVSRDFRIEPEITIKLAKRGARVFEVPISYSGRTYQEGKKINWKDGLRALTAIAHFALSDRIFKRDAYGSELAPRLARAPRYTRWLADTIRPFVGERVLELGAGIGGLTINLVPRSEYWACDPNPLMVRELSKLSLTRPYIRGLHVDPASPDGLPQNRGFDTVILQNVIEHLDDDVGALRKARLLVAGAGRVVVLVPQGPWLYGSLDRVLGHARRYSRRQLLDAASAAGLECEKILPFNRAGSVAWWINARLLRRANFPVLQIVTLNWLVPVLRMTDRLLPAPPLTLVGIFRPKDATNASPPREFASEPVAQGSRL